MWWAIRKLGVEEWLVRVEQAYVHKCTKSMVRTLSEEFVVKVGFHQGSILTSLLWYFKHCRVSSDQDVHRNYY